MEHTTYTSQRALLPEVWRPLASTWLGLVRAMSIAREVDPDGLVTTIRRYGLDTPETVAFVRRAVNRDMGKGRDVKEPTRRRKCEKCGLRWCASRSHYCPECYAALLARHQTCAGCGTPLPPGRSLRQEWCTNTCYVRNRRKGAMEGLAAHNRVH